MGPPSLSECGETGRRKGLKIPRRKSCRFDSGHSHQLNPKLKAKAVESYVVHGVLIDSVDITALRTGVTVLRTSRRSVRSGSERLDTADVPYEHAGDSLGNSSPELY